jgi:hypothetical protein
LQPNIATTGSGAITNRQAMHGSFANTSPDWCVTFQYESHRCKSVLVIQGGGRMFMHETIAARRIPMVAHDNL